MELTRREFFGIGKGAAAAAVLAGLGLAGTPRKAQAIIGIDDALLGAVVVAMASLGGYALYSQYVGNNSLQAVGASFSDYVSVSGNREAAIQAAMAAAALHSIGGTQPDFERAGNIIANGEGAFLSAMESAATTGRLSLDALVSGSDSLVGMMRELVSGWLGSGVVGDVPKTVPNSTVVGTGANAGTLPVSFGIEDIRNMATRFGTSLPISTSTGYYYLAKDWQSYDDGLRVGTFTVGDGSIVGVQVYGASFQVNHSGAYYEINLEKNGSRVRTYGRWERLSYGSTSTQYTNNNWVATPGVFGGPLLPGVDRTADAPDVIGAGWDSVPLAMDMVISPTTGGITGAGSVPLPTGIPSTAGDYAAALQGALAGVVPGAIALPQSLSVPVTVATPTGVVTMPISEAIASETSLQLDYAPDVPITPVLPPVDVPEGPWTPAVELPFMNIWPFNMIYSFIETMGRLGS